MENDFKPSPRELDLAQLASYGLNGKEIAKRLGISVATVRNEKFKACGRLGVRPFSLVVIKAFAQGLIL